jgi:hypothetical protein
MSFKSLTLGLALTVAALLAVVVIVASGFAGGDAVYVALAPLSR